MCGCALVALSFAAPASAQELSFSVGRFLGDDLADAGAGPGGLLPTSFDDAGLYGVRLGMGFVLVDIEASGLIGQTAILDGTLFETEARFRYLEGSVLLRLLPGPVAPFVAAGIGWHRLSVDLDQVPDYEALGYSVGGGIKIMLGSFGIRGDVRDHITPVSLEDLEPELADALGLDVDETLHNFEISVGLVLAF